jgi:hypothetical protein
MSDASFDNLVSAYVRHLKRRYPDAESDAVGEQMMFAVIGQGDPEAAWPVLVAAIERLDDEEDLCYAGCGELESLLRDYGEQFWSRVEAVARQSKKFQTALSCVWAWDAPIRPRIDALMADLGIEPS